jgi:hypothetical protein
LNPNKVLINNYRHGGEKELTKGAETSVRRNAVVEVERSRSY